MATSVIGRAIRVVVVLGGVGLAGWLWHAGRGRDAQAPTESDALASAQRLAAWLREKAAALQARAATLSDLPRLAAAVGTDAETVRDLTRDELGFSTAPNETVELAQLSTAAGAATTLLHVPESSAWRADWATAMPRAGGEAGDVAIAIDGAWLVMTRTRAIVPRDRSDMLGAIAVAWRFPVTELSAAVDAGTLVVGGATVAIGGGVPAGVRTTNVVLPGIPSAATLETALGPAATMPDWSVRALGAGAGTALALLGLVWPRRRREAARSPSRAMSMPAMTPTQELASLSPASETEHPAQGGHRANGPARVGRYEPVALMRADDGARVYVARATGEAGFERRVTLAVFDARDEEVAQAFVGEARRAARVQHPNVVEVLDIGGSPDACYVATEYVEGGDLALLLAHLRSLDRRVPVDIAVAIARRMCDGLAAAHAATDERGAPLGLLHGGLAPSTVTISRTGNVKVGDFGLARAAGSLAPPSIAPELRQRDGAPDVRADVFGVGAVLYELLAGAPPLDEVAPLSRADVPLELDSTVMRALAHDRRARQRDCAALEAELAAIARDRSLEAGDKRIAQWLATDVQSWSPTLRGWQAAAEPRLAQLFAPRPAPRLERPSARALAHPATSSRELRGSGLRGPAPEQQRTVNVRPVARASTPPATKPPPESGEDTAVAEWHEPANEARRPRASSPRFYEVAAPASGTHARASGTATKLPTAGHAWPRVPETQTTSAVAPKNTTTERRTQSVDHGWTDDEKTS